MTDLSTLTISELQNYGISGDEDAILELGKRVLDMNLDYVPDEHPECSSCGAPVNG